MKTLIIHPKDPSTKFLEGIYRNIPDKTVISGGVNRIQLLDYIQNHDQIICCGHGSPLGLFSVGQFPDSNPYIIDDSLVKYLKNKPNNLYIWCNADQFVKRNQLNGFCTQMFISEVNEALYYNFPCSNKLKNIIDESNYGFSESVGRHIEKPIDVMYNLVLNEYGQLAKSNPIASFNFKRLVLMRKQPSGFSNKVRNTN